MVRVREGSSDEVEIDGALSEWRQGDFALTENWFTFVADGSRALTDEGDRNGAEIHVAQSEGVEGLVVVTQTCDVVRNCLDRPFVEVSPLVWVSADDYHQIERGRRPNYVAIPALAEKGLVADLDRTMTVEKSVVAGWERTEGCRTDGETRDFARALARKRERPAFPDEFVLLLRRLADRIKEKHDKQSVEGNALRALREIRVRAAPDWRAERVEVTIWFVLADDAAARPTVDQVDIWLGFIDPSDRYQPIGGLLISLDDITARDYAESDRLDLDHLTESPEATVFRVNEEMRVEASRRCCYGSSR